MTRNGPFRYAITTFLEDQSRLLTGALRVSIDRWLDDCKRMKRRTQADPLHNPLRVIEYVTMYAVVIEDPDLTIPRDKVAGSTLEAVDPLLIEGVEEVEHCSFLRQTVDCVTADYVHVRPLPKPMSGIAGDVRVDLNSKHFIGITSA